MPRASPRDGAAHGQLGGECDALPATLDRSKCMPEFSNLANPERSCVSLWLRSVLFRLRYAGWVWSSDLGPALHTYPGRPRAATGRTLTYLPLPSLLPRGYATWQSHDVESHGSGRRSALASLRCSPWQSSRKPRGTAGPKQEKTMEHSRREEAAHVGDNVAFPPEWVTWR